MPFPRLRSLHELDRSDGTAQLHDGDQARPGSILLVPQPAAHDANDPLRWPRWRKGVAFGAVCLFTVMSNYGIGGLAPAFYLLSAEFDKTMDETGFLLTWPVLVFGLCNFIWVPVANRYGKRPVFVFCSLLLCACYVWGALAGSFASLLWSNCIAAVAGSATEALAASIVSDLYFLHERGSKMGWYMNAITGGNTIGPLFCAFTISGLSWRWHKWISVILMAINCIAVVLFVPETTFRRDQDRTAARENNRPAEVETETVAVEKRPGTGTWTGTGTGAGTGTGTGTGADHSGRDSDSPYEVPRKTYREQLSLWTGAVPDTSIVTTFCRPAPLIVYPCVVFALVAYAVSLVLTVAINILNPFVLQAAPYNWSPTVNGLINIAGLMGNLAGALAGGRLVDLFVGWRARRNGGLFEPETRLWLLLPPLFVTTAGSLLFGYGVQRSLHWTSLFFANGMVGFALAAVPSITMAYVTDCLLPVNADALMLVNGWKNIVAFAFLFALVPWITRAGYVNVFGALAGIFAAVIAIGGGLLIAFGGAMRRRQAHWHLIL